jgi:hypothetical protein
VHLCIRTQVSEAGSTQARSLTEDSSPPGPEGTTRDLVEITADLSRIPAYRYPQERGADGCLYYVAAFAIEVTYYSAYTKYELIHDGINYGLVASEYV